MSKSASRRDFLKTSALAGTGFWAAGGLTAAPSKQPGPNDRVNVAAIGAGGQGGSDTNQIAAVAGVNIVALCDVDEARAGKQFARFPKAARYSDYRVMLEKQKDIDAVIVATPDHMHAHASIRAMRMGKHCYTEKPLCHSVSECRLMKETAQKHRVATQMGNQGSGSGELRRCVEVVRSGAIGDVREVHVWTNRPTWAQDQARPAGTPMVPKTLNWQQWLGPAPERPYNPAYLPFSWRGWWDFGTGALGDMACHIMNLPYRALSLGDPTSVIAEIDTPLSTESPPMGCRVTYEFPARGKLPAVTLHWYERRRPPEKLLLGQKLSSGGSLMVGSRGTLYSASDYGAASNMLLPAKNFRDFKNPAPTLPRTAAGHYGEWIAAIRGGPAAFSNFVDYSGQFTEMVLLGNVAMRVGGKRIVWDAAQMRAQDLPAANPFIRREYRKGWEL